MLTDAPCARSRFTARYASLMRAVDLEGRVRRTAAVTRPAGGATFQSVTRSNGPENGSSTRSNATPIW